MTADGAGWRLRLRRLAEAADRALRSRPRAVRAALLVAVLGAASWPLVVELEAKRSAAADPRPAYVNRVRERIQVATEAALGRARPRAGPAGLRLQIEVDAEGRLAASRIVESSGSAELDRLALDIVRSAAPFEPFPPGMRRTTKLVELASDFHFR